MKILIIGDGIIDKYTFGNINRMSPEDETVPVVDMSESEYRLGGAYNVAANIKALSPASEVFVSTIMSNYTQSQLKSKGISTKELKKSNEMLALTSPSNGELVKERIVNLKTRKQIVRIDNRQRFTEKEVQNWKITFPFILKEYDAIVISDYNKGIVDEFILNLLAHYKGTVFIDSKKHDLSLFSKIENCVVKINAHEAAKASNENKLKNLIVTHGKEGCTLYSKGTLVKNYTTLQVEDNAEVTGAGDVFLSAFAVRYMETYDFDESISFANKAAMISVLCFGTSVVSRDLVEFYE